MPGESMGWWVVIAQRHLPEDRLIGLPGPLWRIEVPECRTVASPLESQATWMPDDAIQRKWRAAQQILIVKSARMV